MTKSKFPLGFQTTQAARGAIASSPLRNDVKKSSATAKSASAAQQVGATAGREMSAEEEAFFIGLDEHYEAFSADEVVARSNAYLKTV